MNTTDKPLYTPVQCVSLRPDKLVMYTKFLKNFSNQKTIKKDVEKINNLKKLNTFHNYEISEKAQKNIKERLTWLYHISKSKSITTNKHKNIFNFRMSFITLTLPSTQVHSSGYITKHILHTFLTDLQRVYNCNNYIWRAEYQKNGNIHYHLATDVYIEYYKLRKLWNRVLHNHGYIQPYIDKFSKMSLFEYSNYVRKQSEVDQQTINARYSAGVSTNWSQPNTVDIRVVTSKKNIGYYISKYITKNSNDKRLDSVITRDSNDIVSRNWFCSRSLSKLKPITYIQGSECDLFISLVSSLRDIKAIAYDYCTVWYFQIEKQSKRVRGYFDRLLKAHAISLGIPIQV